MSYRAALIGTGYIGGSFLLALRDAGAITRAVGHDLKLDAAEQARARGIVDQVAASAGEAAEGAELVVIATPVAAIAGVVDAIAPRLAPGCLVMDVGSIKGPAAAAAERLPVGVFLVGAHPIAGRERSGPDFAHHDLFRGRLCLLCPTARSDESALDRAAALWRAAGADVERIEAADHDALLARTSHLPHVAAYALAAAIALGLSDEQAARAGRVAGDSLRDTTRVAASDPAMWRDVMLGNRAALLPLIDALLDETAALRRAIAAQDDAALIELLERGRRGRSRLARS